MGRASTNRSRARVTAIARTPDGWRVSTAAGDFDGARDCMLELQSQPGMYPDAERLEKRLTWSRPAGHTPERTLRTRKT
jgi:hypothetical protein